MCSCHVFMRSYVCCRVGILRRLIIVHSKTVSSIISWLGLNKVRSEANEPSFVTDSEGSNEETMVLFVITYQSNTLPQH